MNPFNPLTESAKVHAVRAAVLASFGSLVFLFSPSRATMLVYEGCCVRAVYETALCLEDIPAAMPPINPS